MLEYFSKFILIPTFDTNVAWLKMARIWEAFSSLEEQCFLFLEKVSNNKIDSFIWFAVAQFHSNCEKVRKFSRIVALSYSFSLFQAITLLSSSAAFNRPLHLQSSSLYPKSVRPVWSLLTIHLPHFLLSNGGAIKLAAFVDEATAVTQDVFCHTLVNDVGGGGHGCSVCHAAGSHQLRQPNYKSPSPPALG